jgi:hypothetical protein
MNPASFNLGRYSRLALLLLLLTAQGIAVAHDIGDSHALKSDLCATCIIGHGLGTAVGSSYAASPLQVCQTFAAVHSITATPAPHTNCHFARAPPLSSWNTQNPN